MTLPPLDKLRELLEKATPGPWRINHTRANGTEVAWSHPDSQICVMRWHDGMHETVTQRIERDAELIALSPALAERVLADAERIEALEKKIASIYSSSTTPEGVDLWTK